MIVRTVASLLAFAALSACGADAKAPTDANFRSAINAELAKDNPYCLRLEPGLPSGIPRSPLTTALGHRGLLEPMGTAWRMNADSEKALFQGRKRPGLGLWACIADGAEVAEVVNWTEPATTITKVTYVMKPTKIAVWITPEIAPLIPQLTEARERTIGLHLTAKGWERSRP